MNDYAGRHHSGLSRAQRRHLARRYTDGDVLHVDASGSKYVITPSMSRRGSCHGNAIAENFFSILKTECIYRHKPASLEEANDMFARFIYFYNHERIQLKTGAAATK